MKFERIETKQSDGVSGGGNFLKIESGQSVTGVFRGEIGTFWQAWPRGGAKQVFSEPTPGSALRFRANFVVHENGKFVAKVYEFGVMVNNTLFEIQQENIDLTTTKVKISRYGSGKNDTRYVVLPLGPVPPKALKEIEAVELRPVTPPQISESVPFENEIELETDAEELPF